MFSIEGGSILKKGTLLSFLIFWIFLLSGCTNAEKEQLNLAKNLESAHPTLIIATGDRSGVYFLLGQALASLYEKYNHAATGTQVTNASLHNNKLVSQKQAELGFSTVDALALSETKKSQVRAISGLYSNYIHVVTTKKSGIQTLMDLRGKRVSVGTIGSGTKLMSERVLKAAGLENNEMDLSYLSFTQSADALRNGTIDVAFFSSGLPNPEIATLAKEMDISLVSIPKQVANRLHEQYEFYKWNEISGGIYEGITNKTGTISVKNVLLTYADLPNQEAYQLVKTFYDHLPELQNVHPSVREIHPSEATLGIPIDIHPGAYQFLTEILQKQK